MQWLRCLEIHSTYARPEESLCMHSIVDNSTLDSVPGSCLLYWLIFICSICSLNFMNLNPCNGFVSGVKATYLLVVAFLEILRFSNKGGAIKRSSGDLDHISLLTCVFKYLESPNLPPDLYQCLTATVHCVFDAALTWLVCFWREFVIV